MSIGPAYNEFLIRRLLRHHPAGLSEAAITAALAGKQPLDADLTAIAALSPANDDVLQRKAGAWTNRTIAQLVSDLGLAATYQPLDSDLTAIAALSTTSFGRSLLTSADADAAADSIRAVQYASAPTATPTTTLSPGWTPIWREDFADADTRITDTVGGTFRRVPLGPQLDGGHPTGFAAVPSSVGMGYATWTVTGGDGATAVNREVYGQWAWVDTDNVPTAFEGATAPQFSLVQSNSFSNAGNHRIWVDNSAQLRITYTQSGAVTYTGTCPRRRWFWVGLLQDPVDVNTHRWRYLLYDPLTTTLTTLVDFNTASDGVKASYVGVINLSGVPRQHAVRVGGLGRYTRSSAAASATWDQCWTLPANTCTLYVNPATGSDSNDGTSPERAWATADKITTEMLGGGILPLASSPVAPGRADVAGAGTQIVIDTTTATLAIGDTLDIAQSDVWVRPADGQTYIRCESEVVLTPGSWANVSGNVYKQAITTTLPDIHVWDVKVGQLPKLYTKVANAAAVTSAGKWAIESAELYIWTYDSSNPGSDGVRRVRSRFRGSLNTGPAVQLRGRNQRLTGIKSWFTATSRTPLDDNGAYAIQDASGFGGRAVIEYCDVRYCGKHALGTTASTTDSHVTFRGNRGEQCWSTSTGGATVFVSYMTSNGGTGNEHYWIDCRCDAGLMVAGSPEGSISQFSPAFLMHGNDSGTPFTVMSLSNCHFGATGTGFQTGAAASATVTGGSHALDSYIPVTATSVSLRAAPDTHSGTGSFTLVTCTNDY